MNRLIIAVALLVSIASSLGAETKSLFDGKTFEGWEGDTNKTFRIVDGAIVGGTPDCSMSGSVSV